MRDKIARWHAQGLWSAQMVKNAVGKGVITEDDYNTIVFGSRSVADAGAATEAKNLS